MEATQNETPTENLGLTFDGGETAVVPVQLDSKALARQKRTAKLADAKAYEALGQRLLKFKAKKYGEVGEYIVTTLGVKKVGHGTIISASENADQYIARCDALIGELLSRDPPCDPDAVVALMGLVRDFNRQLLDSGEAHIKIDRQPSIAPEGNTMSIPFPQGTPMVIAMGQQQLPALPAVEAGEPEV